MQGVCSATNAGVESVRGGKRHGIEGISGGTWRKMDIKSTGDIELDATVDGYDLVVEVGDESLRIENFWAGGLS